MYEPSEKDIEYKINEIVFVRFNDNDYLTDALIEHVHLIRKLLNCKLEDLADMRTDALQAVEKSLAVGARDKAVDALTNETGYTKRVDVDDYRFVLHDTRN
jgi:hypothetical protein